VPQQPRLDRQRQALLAPVEMRQQDLNLNEILARWAMRKYKRLRYHHRRARRFLADIARREPGLFAHWRLGVWP
jgi:hypothetical protein